MIQYSENKIGTRFQEWYSQNACFLFVSQDNPTDQTDRALKKLKFLLWVYIKEICYIGCVIGKTVISSIPETGHCVCFVIEEMSNGKDEVMGNGLALVGFCRVGGQIHLRWHKEFNHLLGGFL